MSFQIIIGIVFFGGLSASSDGNSFFFVDNRRVDRYQCSADESKVDRAETDYGKSVENKQSRVIVLSLEKLMIRF